MQIKHEHPAIQEQEQYEQELSRAFAACIRKLRQADGYVAVSGVPDEIN